MIIKILEKYFVVKRFIVVARHLVSRMGFVVSESLNKPLTQ